MEARLHDATPSATGDPERGHLPVGDEAVPRPLPRVLAGPTEILPARSVDQAEQKPRTVVSDTTYLVTFGSGDKPAPDQLYCWATRSCAGVVDAARASHALTQSSMAATPMIAP